MVGHVNSSASAHTPAPPYSYHPEVVRIEVGLKQLSFVTLCNALEDAIGRTPLAARATRRTQAAQAIRWLRDRESVGPFTLNWCSEILNVSAKHLANEGVDRIPNSGLKHWRLWRATRDVNRITFHPVLKITCPVCGAVIKARQPKTYCSRQCQVIGMAERRVGRRARTHTQVSVSA